MDAANTAIHNAAAVLVTLKGAAWAPIPKTSPQAPPPELSKITPTYPHTPLPLPPSSTSSLPAAMRRPGAIRHLPLPPINSRMLPISLPKLPTSLAHILTSPPTDLPLPHPPTLLTKRRSSSDYSSSDRHLGSPTSTSSSDHNEALSSHPAFSDASDTPSPTAEEASRQKRQRRPCSRYNSQDYELIAKGAAAQGTLDAVTAASCAKADDDSLSGLSRMELSQHIPLLQHLPRPHERMQQRFHHHQQLQQQVDAASEEHAVQDRVREAAAGGLLGGRKKVGVTMQKLPSTCGPLLSALVATGKPMGMAGLLKPSLAAKVAAGQLGFSRSSSSNSLRQMAAKRALGGLVLPSGKMPPGIEIRVQQKAICGEVH